VLKTPEYINFFNKRKIEVFNYIVQFFLPHSGRLQILAGLLLAVGIWADQAKPLLSNDLRSLVMSDDTALTRKLPEKDGIYLYGQSPEPEQIGQEYMVFEIHQDKVIGAFYLPQSEFSCFYGRLQSGKLAVMVADSPDLDTHPTPVAGQNQQVAAASNRPLSGNSYSSIAYPYSVALQNYHQIASVSANDQRILRTCKNNY